MSLLDLLDALTRAGTRLALDGGKIVADGPRGALDPELLEALKTHKPAVLVSLGERTGPCPRCASPIFLRIKAGPVVCPGCHPGVAGVRLVWRDDLKKTVDYDEAFRVLRTSERRPRLAPDERGGRS